MDVVRVQLECAHFRLVKAEKNPQPGDETYCRVCGFVWVIVKVEEI